MYIDYQTKSFLISVTVELVGHCSNLLHILPIAFTILLVWEKLFMILMFCFLSRKAMEDISFSLEGICPIPPRINRSPSPSPIDQNPSPIQDDLTPFPSPIIVDSSSSPHEDEVNNVEAQGGICRLKSKIWHHFKRIKVNGLDKAECKYCKKLLGGK